MSSSSHLRRSKLRNEQRWVKAHPPKARKTTHTIYAVEDAAEGPITCDTRHAQPVDLVEAPNYVSTNGHTRRSMDYAFVDDSF